MCKVKNQRRDSLIKNVNYALPIFSFSQVNITLALNSQPYESIHLSFYVNTYHSVLWVYLSVIYQRLTLRLMSLSVCHMSTLTTQSYESVCHIILVLNTQSYESVCLSYSSWGELHYLRWNNKIRASRICLQETRTLSYNETRSK